MAQIFHRSTNTLSRVTIFGAAFFAAGALWLLAIINRSGYVTNQNVVREQPVQFSHKHHAGELGIDCRYCHTSVEVSPVASVPPTKTCINCHSQIWAQSEFLEPVRASFRTDESIRWIRVNDLPDFVYFNHSVHVHKGIGCVSCHGRVDQMNQLYQAVSLQMEWCLACHRNPEPNVRPREQVFNMAWEPPADQAGLGRQLVKAYDVHPRTDCSTCHR
jgi:Cytochrome c7 and related cytochrome c/Class III cytochrome C family